MADSATPPALPVEGAPAGRLEGVAWGLLSLTAALACYFGLSAVFLPVLGDPGSVKGIDRWLGPLVGLGQVAFAMAIVFARRRRAMGAAVTSAACILMLGWIGLLPTAFRTGLGLGFGPEARWTSGALLAAPVIAGLGVAMARRHPVAAALIVTTPAALVMLAGLALGVVIALNGF